LVLAFTGRSFVSSCACLEILHLFLWLFVTPAACTSRQ
jgi:hypothetical protein